MPRPRAGKKTDSRPQARKNPAVNSDHYISLPGQLEYFDLRELQDTITNKVLWPEFESRFGTKEILVERFGQLAELRYCIRHSRAVDDVTRKLGEAAILWFRQVLKQVTLGYDQGYCLTPAWTGSWTGALDNPSAASAVNAMIRVICAARTLGAWGRTSHIRRSWFEPHPPHIICDE